MKESKRNSSLAALLARNYLGFTLTLLLIVLGVYALWSGSTETLLSTGYPAELTSSADLRAGRFDRVAAALPKWMAFAVLSGDGQAVYRSDASLPAAFTAGELSCLAEYGSSTYYEAVSFTAPDGETEILVSRTIYEDDGSSTQSSMLLDADHRVLSGGFEAGRASYTQREFELLTGSVEGSGQFSRYDYADDAGERRILILREGSYGYEEYSRAVAQAGRVWLLVIPLYLAAALGFILWLGRRIRRPMEKLNQAIVGLSEGRSANASACGGPRELQRLGENFDAMAARLAESEAERRRAEDTRLKLITDISHDLKTPITVIAGYTSAIRDGKVPAEELPRYLTVIDDKARALSELIDRFYEYSRTQHPDYRLAPAETDLCEFMREYLAGKYDEIDLAGFSLEVSIPEEPVRCRLDAFQFRRALDNILSNSLRHNALGTVIFARLYATPSTAVLRLADNGGGIPAELNGRLFEPFTVGDESRSGGGSGLGLAITRRIVEAHGGRIRLVDPPGRGFGTEFEIALPLAAAPPAEK